MSDWQVYIIHCSDDSYYTGITTDVERRFDQHRRGKGAKYFYGRAPVEIVYVEHCKDRSVASRREAEIKRLSRARKIGLFARSPLPEGEGNREKPSSVPSPLGGEGRGEGGSRGKRDSFS